MSGEARSRELSQFYTPSWLAERVVGWSGITACDRVAEPSAGRGALIKPLVEIGCDVDAWEIDAGNMIALREIAHAGLCAMHCDFLTCTEVVEGAYDVALMNPPYEGNQDVRFIERALDCSDRVVGIFQSRIVHSKGRAEFWRHTDITRMAILSDRPSFGGDHSAKTDFVVLELIRRPVARRQGEATPAQLEWWSR
jgi:predicted RNA methylase